MIRRWQYIKRVVPSKRTCLFFIILYLATYLLDAYCLRQGFEPPAETGRIRIVVLCFFAFFYGVLRVIFFHPLYDRGYASWLALSPYRGRMQLPFGPVHLVEPDWLILGVLSFLAYSNVPVLVILPLIFFMVPYLALLCIAFCYGRGIFAVAVLFLAPLAFYPHKSLYFAAAALLVLYALCYYGLRLQLKSFPWESNWWKLEPIEWLRKQSAAYISRTWPFSVLVHKFEFELPVGVAFIISLLLTWWLHILTWLIEEPIPFGLIGVAVFILGLVRLLAYVCGYMPPISILGRIRTGRLIIPGYDKVFLAPVIVIVTGMCLPAILGYLGVGYWLSSELTVFLVLFEAMALPPKLKDWRLTAPCRIVRIQQVDTRTKTDITDGHSVARMISPRLRASKH